MKIHISRSGQQMGPYPLEQVNQYLEQGALLPTDSAWHDGMTDWVPLNQINGVVISGESPPPPPPPETTPPAPPTPQENTTACPQCHAPIEADQAFCMGCGANLKNDQLDLGQPMMPPSFNPAATAPSEKGGRKKKLLLLGGIGAGVFALIAIVAVLVLGEKKPLSKEESAELIEAAVRKAAGKPSGELTKADFEHVTELFLGTTRLSDVTALGQLPNLKRLALNNNKVTDVTALETLTQLEYLDLSGNQLDSFPKGLVKLTQLESLMLSNNRLTSLNGIEKLTQLKSLYIGGNQLTNLNGLEQLTELLTLDLTNNRIPGNQIAELQKALPRCDITSQSK